MTKHYTQITVPSAPYADYDNSLSAAAEDYASEPVELIELTEYGARVTMPDGSEQLVLNLHTGRVES